MAEISAVILTFLKAIGKYRWHAVAVSWVVALVGWAVVFSLPNNFQASARVYVDTQSILKPLLANMTALPNIEQQVMFMRSTLISRPNVERVIRMADLDVTTKSQKEHEQLVDDLIDNIKLVGTERDDIYTITYNDPNPKLAKDIVQSLLTIFVEGSFGGKKQESEKAIQFIDDQIRSYEEKLAAAENRVKEFKIQHLGMFPNQGDSSSRLNEMNEQLNMARLQLAEAEQARNAIKRQITGDDPAAVAAEIADPAGANPELEGRIASIQKNIDQLRMQFTDAHPDIVSGKRLLAELEAQKQEELKKRKKSADPGANYSPMLQQLNVQLSVAEAQVASLRTRVDMLAARVGTMRTQIVGAPEIEAQLAQLNRDYEINRENYQKLVERRESAKLSGDLSSATDMLTFRVIDPPTVPSTPAGPHRLRLASLVFAGALAAGLAVALLMSQVRPTFLSQSVLREVTGMPILGTVSMTWTDEQKVRQKRRLWALGISVLMLLAAYSAVIAMTVVKGST
ncbi:chain length-determining protein [Massilia sp. KIM]|uniref:XrtA system polysaccharide chain length determinant n=1 Tax=Massilia sp. KIM TaxID=1955422 RepID=UPI00098F4EC0|nr:XrtA system polysaccharide chain length determinant [Massilia sp. KIM]OON59520.1 chain length-determining protein [Massilia sp. KIM]